VDLLTEIRADLLIDGYSGTRASDQIGFNNAPVVGVSVSIANPTTVLSAWGAALALEFGECPVWGVCRLELDELLLWRNSRFSVLHVRGRLRGILNF
jgi:hypothetical protein